MRERRTCSRPQISDLDWHVDYGRKTKIVAKCEASISSKHTRPPCLTKTRDSAAAHEKTTKEPCDRDQTRPRTVLTIKSASEHSRSANARKSPLSVAWTAKSTKTTGVSDDNDCVAVLDDTLSRVTENRARIEHFASKNAYR